MNAQIDKLLAALGHIRALEDALGEASEYDDDMLDALDLDALQEFKLHLADYLASRLVG